MVPDGGVQQVDRDQDIQQVEDKPGQVRRRELKNKGSGQDYSEVLIDPSLELGPTDQPMVILSFTIRSQMGARVVPPSPISELIVSEAWVWPTHPPQA